MLKRMTKMHVTHMTHVITNVMHVTCVTKPNQLSQHSNIRTWTQASKRLNNFSKYLTKDHEEVNRIGIDYDQEKEKNKDFLRVISQTVVRIEARQGATEKKLKN